MGAVHMRFLLDDISRMKRFFFNEMGSSVWAQGCISYTYTHPPSGDMGHSKGRWKTGGER